MESATVHIPEPETDLSRGAAPLPVGTARVGFTDIDTMGKVKRVPSIEIAGQTVIVAHGWLKVASVYCEEWQAAEAVQAPELFITELRKHRELKADLFTFTQLPTDPAPHFHYPYEWDSEAAIPLPSYWDWWNHSVSTHLRKDVRRAAKRGLVLRNVLFTDEFVRSIMGIYDETPVRQGRPFWHYKKSFEEVKRVNSTYNERAEFVGAYLEDELVGFLKIVYVGPIARLMQIISKEAHHDCRPANALIAKAVECADARHCSLLTYGKYRYSHGADSTTAFKHRNGFEEILVPRYYIPLTCKGGLALQLHLHRGVRPIMPNSLRQILKRARLLLYRFRPERTRVAG